tara:strand:- start:622 stop:789 length:168 start_codon:yes stop_codon:yes gene_type:complete
LIVLQLTGTLGYPGEGPKRLKRLKMAAFNVRGVKGKDDRIYLYTEIGRDGVNIYT